MLILLIRGGRSLAMANVIIEARCVYLPDLREFVIEWLGTWLLSRIQDIKFKLLKLFSLAKYLKIDRHFRVLLTNLSPTEPATSRLQGQSYNRQPEYNT